MKRLKLVVLGIAFCAIFSGCGTSSYNPNYYDVEPDEPSGYSSLEEYIEENCDSEAVFDYLFDHYSNREILEKIGGNDFLDDVGIFNFELFLENLRDYAGDDGIRSLLRIFDKAGTYPESVIGDFFADKNLVIHKTHSTCYEEVPIDDIVFIDPTYDLSTIEKEMINDDSSINGYTICPECIDVNKD